MYCEKGRGRAAKNARRHKFRRQDAAAFDDDDDQKKQETNNKINVSKQIKIKPKNKR